MTLGRLRYVERNEHKGFDYAELVRQLEKHFDVVEVFGHPFGAILPVWCCFSIGVVAKPQKT